VIATRHVALAAIGVSVFLLSPTGVYYALTGALDEPAPSLAILEQERAARLDTGDGGPWRERITPDQAKAMLARTRNVLGTWEYKDTTQTVRFRIVETPSGKAAYRARPSLINAAHACGSHSLVASAGACLDVHFLPVDIVMIVGDFAKPNASATTYLPSTEAYLEVHLDKSTTFIATIEGDKIELNEYYAKPLRQTLRRIAP
jgi:hypothetical protein